MSIHKRWAFNERMVRDAPDCRGVYVLWQERRPLAAGHAGGAGDTIQARLLIHLEHVPAAGTEAVSHYSWEICADPERRRREIERELGLRGGAADAAPETS